MGMDGEYQFNDGLTIVSIDIFGKNSPREVYSSASATSKLAFWPLTSLSFSSGWCIMRYSLCSLWCVEMNWFCHIFLYLLFSSFFTMHPVEEKKKETHYLLRIWNPSWLCFLFCALLFFMLCIWSWALWRSILFFSKPWLCFSAFLSSCSSPVTPT